MSIFNGGFILGVSKKNDETNVSAEEDEDDADEITRPMSWYMIIMIYDELIKHVNTARSKSFLLFL